MSARQLELELGCAEVSEGGSAHKDSPFEKKSIERTLSVELSGTLGVVAPPLVPGQWEGRLQRPPRPLPGGAPGGASCWPSSAGPRPHPTRARRGSAGPNAHPRLFGDHDYCQASAAADRPPPRARTAPSCASRPEIRCMLAATEPSSSCSSSCSSCSCSSSSSSSSSTGLGQPSATRRPLRDQEVRAGLNKHFGLASQATAPPVGAECHCSARLLLGAVLEASGEQRDELLFPCEGSHPDLMLTRSSPSCSPPSCYPPRGSVSRPMSRPGSHPSAPACPPRAHALPAARPPHGLVSMWTPALTGPGHTEVPATPGPHTPSSHTRRPRYKSYEEQQQECLKREEPSHREEERRVVCIGRLRSDVTRTELKRRLEVFGEIEECTVNLRDDGDNFGLMTYRYPCDAVVALETGPALRQLTEPKFEMCSGGRRQYCRSMYADLDSHSEDSDPASTRSKYDSLDFDSLLREAQRSLRR
ncbi:hypothetical protein AAFF_G00363320 [Aldrovandia affinis]|uniref:Uncharacterized protein n=1 Tax=Aldrovandia affinis TaxID=143900 RepID=A0AAD7R791_9TELE|nr:hypothetical protein AAFF_G00363320 [Aldrovandia affinis]